jgi:hypothetical protein
MRKSFCLLMFLAFAPALSRAAEPLIEAAGPWSLYLGGSCSIVGRGGMGATGGVMPDTNARKYGFNRGPLDVFARRSLYLGRQIADWPFDVEVGLEGSSMTYESALPAGPASTVTSTYVSSLMVAPVYLWRGRYLNWGLGLRLGVSSLAAQVESATPTTITGSKDEYSAVFACEPFARIEAPLFRHFKIGFEAAYAYRNFWQVFNTNMSGIYANDPLTEKNPDGSDTSVDLSGWSDRGYLAFVF